MPGQQYTFACEHCWHLRLREEPPNRRCCRCRIKELLQPDELERLQLEGKLQP